MPDKCWKATERRIARLLGGHRTGPTGAAGADVIAGRYAVEVKHRQSLPAWLLAAVDQARSAAAPGQTGILVLHQHGARSDGDLVVMQLGDFLKLRGGQ